MYCAGIAQSHAMASHAQGNACEGGARNSRQFVSVVVGMRRDSRRKQASPRQGFSASRHRLNHNNHPIAICSVLLSALYQSQQILHEASPLLTASQAVPCAMLLDRKATCCSTKLIMPNCPHDAPLTPIIGSCAQRRLEDPVIPTLPLIVKSSTSSHQAYRAACPLFSRIRCPPRNGSRESCAYQVC